MKLQEIIPNVIYDNGEYKFKNIFYKYVLTEPIEDKYLSVYRLSDDETLEDVSYEMYGDPIYFWTIIIINNLSDPIFDIAISEDAIQRMARYKSTVDGELDMDLYIQNYDELSTENDTKRELKVIKTEYLNKFLTEVIRSTENL